MMTITVGGQMPEELAGAAEASDKAMAAAAAKLAPKLDRPLPRQVFNGFAEALKGVVELFSPDATVELTPASGPVAALPGDVAAAYLMVAKAAEDAGMPLPVKLEDLASDTDFLMAAGALRGLITSPEFAEFLAGEDEGAAEAAMAETGDDTDYDDGMDEMDEMGEMPEPPFGADDEDEYDAMFRRRMRR
jgi:hypothetical protein